MPNKLFWYASLGSWSLQVIARSQSGHFGGSHADAMVSQITKFWKFSNVGILSNFKGPFGHVGMVYQRGPCTGLTHWAEGSLSRTAVTLGSTTICAKRNKTPFLQIKYIVIVYLKYDALICNMHLVVHLILVTWANKEWVVFLETYVVTPVPRWGPGTRDGLSLLLLLADRDAHIRVTIERVLRLDFSTDDFNF